MSPCRNRTRPPAAARPAASSSSLMSDAGHLVAEVGEGDCVPARPAGDVQELAPERSRELVHEPRLVDVGLLGVDLVVDPGMQARVRVHERTAASSTRSATIPSTSSSLSDGDEGR